MNFIKNNNASAKHIWTYTKAEIRSEDVDSCSITGRGVSTRAEELALTSFLITQQTAFLSYLLHNIEKKEGWWGSDCL